MALGPAEEGSQELRLLPRIDVAAVLGDPPAVQPAAPAGGEIAGFLVQHRGAVPVLEDAGLGAGRDALPEPLDARRDERGLDELARQLIQLLEEQPLPRVGEDPVRVPQDPVDPAEVVAEPRRRRRCCRGPPRPGAPRACGPRSAARAGRALRARRCGPARWPRAGRARKPRRDARRGPAPAAARPAPHRPGTADAGARRRGSSARSTPDARGSGRRRWPPPGAR